MTAGDRPATLAKKHGIRDVDYKAILEHHDDTHDTVEAFLVAAADAISAARPGARGALNRPGGGPAGGCPARGGPPPPPPPPRPCTPSPGE